MLSFVLACLFRQTLRNLVLIPLGCLVGWKMLRAARLCRRPTKRTLEEQLQEADATLACLQTEMDAMKRRVAALDTTTETANTAMRSLTDYVGVTNERLLGLETGLKVIPSKFEDITTAIHSTTESSLARFATSAEQMSNLETGLKEISSTFETLLRTQIEDATLAIYDSINYYSTMMFKITAPPGVTYIEDSWECCGKMGIISSETGPTPSGQNHIINLYIGNDSNNGQVEFFCIKFKFRSSMTFFTKPDTTDRLTPISPHKLDKHWRFDANQIYIKLVFPQPINFAGYLYNPNMCFPPPPPAVSGAHVCKVSLFVTNHPPKDDVFRPEDWRLRST